MVVNCEQVWSEVSNYLEGDVSEELRSAIEEHVRGCNKCTAVLDGTRNVLVLYGDERMLEVPLGFSQRLRRRLDAQTGPQRGTSLGWLVAIAATALLAGSLAIAGYSSPQPVLRSQHAQPGVGIPPSLMVVASDEGKTFHLPGCTYIHDKTHLRTMASAEAEREGYTPCTRCLKKYLEITGLPHPLRYGAQVLGTGE